MSYIAIIAMAIIMEGIIAYGKTIFVDKTIKWQIIAAICLGTAVAIAYKLDLLAYAGLTTDVPYIGNILTGILLSRGSNYIADLSKTLLSLKKTEAITDGDEGTEGNEI